MCSENTFKLMNQTEIGLSNQSNLYHFILNVSLSICVRVLVSNLYFLLICVCLKDVVLIQFKQQREKCTNVVCEKF